MRFPLAYIGLGAAALFGVPSLFAQPSDALLQLEPMVVSASRFDESAANIPVNIDVITRQQIEQSGATNIVEVLEKEAGVFFRSTTGNASQAEVDLRGFGENSGVRTLVLVDGVKLNRPDIGSLNWLQIPLSEIESVEVLRGAQTALYGNNATGGVIKITTRRGSGEPGGSAAMAVGTYGLFDVRGGYAGRSGGLTAAANAEYNQLDGYRENSRYEATSGGASLGYEFTPKLSLQGAFAYTETRSLLPGGLTLAEAQANPRQSLNQPATDFSNENIWRFDAALDYDLKEHDYLALNTGYNRRQLDWNLSGPGANVLIQTLTVSPRHVLEWDAWKLVYGLDYIYDDLDFTTFQNNRTIESGQGALARNSLGGYGQIQYAFAPGWLASAGLRLEGSFLDGQNTDPRTASNDFNASKEDFGVAFDLGLVYKVSPELRLWGRFDRLYRYPATDEIASYQGFPLIEPFNFGLDPETGYNAELGVDWERDGYFATANGYAMWLNGEIGFDFGRNLNVNIGDTRRLGLELALGYQAERWGLRLDYAYIDAQYTSGLLNGLDIWLVPRQRVAVRGEVRPLKRLSLVARYSYTAEQLQGNDQTGSLPRIPPYQLVDLMARHTVRDWLEVFVGVDNLFDEEYFSLAFLGTFYPATGRVFKVGATVQF